MSQGKHLNYTLSAEHELLLHFICRILKLIFDEKDEDELESRATSCADRVWM